MLENLQHYKIYLASKSPRRRELLADLRIPFNVISRGGIDESYPDTIPVQEVPQYLANLKADAYLATMHEDELLITADTLVILEGKILGKPQSMDDAREMLKSLSGKVHEVVSGVCIATHNRRVSISASTEVKFATIRDEDIEYYVENFRPLDKAGAYGIQEWIGCVAVEWIRGSFYNVMGLPVHRLYQELSQF